VEQADTPQIGATILVAISARALSFVAPFSPFLFGRGWNLGRWQVALFSSATAWNDPVSFIRNAFMRKRPHFQVNPDRDERRIFARGTPHPDAIKR